MSAQNLAALTGASEAEISKEAQRLAESTKGRIAELQRLEAWLLRTQQGPQQKTQAAFASMSATTETHPMEDATKAFSRAAGGAGYAASPPAPLGAQPSVAQTLDNAGQGGADKLMLQELAVTASATSRGFSFTDGSPPSFPNLLLPNMADLQGKNTGGKGDDARNLMFEKLKNEMQKFAEMTQLMGSVYAAMSEQGMTAIRNVKA